MRVRQGLKEQLAKPRALYSLRVQAGLIVLLFSLLGACGSAYLSLRSSERAITEMSRRLLIRVATRVDEHLNYYLSAPRQATHTAYALARTETLSMDRPQAWRRFLVSQLEQHERITTVFFGTATGRVASARRLSARTRQFELRDHTTRGLEEFRVDREGNLLGPTTPTPAIAEELRNYDPRSRPWYQIAAARQEPGWTDIYRFVSSEEAIGISFAQPLYEEGELRAVFGADITLSELSRFLRDQRVGTNGAIAIVDEHEHTLVATSTSQPTLDSHGRPRPMHELEHPLLLPALDHADIDGQDPHSFRYQAGDEMVVARARPYRDGFGLNWWIIVAVPEADFVDDLRSMTARNTAAIIAFCMLVGLLFAYVYHRRVVKPVLKLKDAANKISEGKHAGKIAIRRLDELGSLSLALQRSSRRLRRLRERLLYRAKNEQEMAVASRLQTSLLPLSHRHTYFDIHASMHPATLVGGDYYDIIDKHGRTWIAIGDVSGHGLLSGLIANTVRASLHTILQREGVSIVDAVFTLNERLREDLALLNESQFMTFTLFCTSDGETFEYCGLHEEHLILRYGNGGVEGIEHRGGWIGLPHLTKEDFGHGVFRLFPGDALILFSDGVTEAMDAREELYGIDRLRSRVASAAPGTSRDLHDWILSDVRAHMTRQRDDITLFVLRRPIEPAAESNENFIDTEVNH